MTVDKDLIEKILWAALSALLTGGGLYWSVVQKLSFIEGQLSQLMLHFGSIHKVKEGLAVLDKDHGKTRIDLQHLYDRVKRNEDIARANGSGHG